MCVSKAILYIVLLLFYSTKVNGVEQTAANSSVMGYGYEMIIAKLEYLQYKLIEIELTMKEDREIVDQKLTHQETLSEGLLWAIDQKLSVAVKQMRQEIGFNITALQIQTNKILSQQVACADHEQMRKEIQMIESKRNWTLLTTFRESESTPQLIRSCKQEPSKRSGKYMIQPTVNDAPFEGYCDQTNFGGGWLVIQHRFDGSVDFYRNWTEYQNGFGRVNGEFWLGLERIHRLTAARPYELLVELKDFSGNYSFALYNAFEIGSEGEQYPLKKLGAYTGTAGDSLNSQRTMKFSTLDRENDLHSSTNCASERKGAWWYKDCSNSNLNGVYENVANKKNVYWYYYKNNYMGLAYSRMSIREI